MRATFDGVPAIGGIPKAVIDDAIDTVRDEEWQSRLTCLSEQGATVEMAERSAVDYWKLHGEKVWAWGLANRAFRFQPFQPSNGLDSPCPATHEGKSLLRDTEQIVDWQARRVEEEFVAKRLALYAPDDPPVDVPVMLEEEAGSKWLPVVAMLLLCLVPVVWVMVYR